MSFEISVETHAMILRNAAAQGMDVDTYLRALMAGDADEFVAAVNAGLSDIDAGRVRPAREALAELGAKLGFSR